MPKEKTWGIVFPIAKVCQIRPTHAGKELFKVVGADQNLRYAEERPCYEVLIVSHADVGTVFCRADGNRRCRANNNSIPDQSGRCALFACSEVDIFIWLVLPDYRGSDDNYRGDMCSLVHQVMVRRLTFALFRLYAAAVSAGIGSVFGWCLGWWIMAKGYGVYGWLLWGVGMLVLVSGFAITAYKGARVLRGSAPRNFTWISAEAFAGL